MLEQIGLPTHNEPMRGTRAQWHGLDLKILRGYGVVAEHYEIWAPVAELAELWRTLTTSGAVPVGAATLEAFRIAEGIPVYGTDIAERDLPQETSQMRALHFNKGCYIGQEIVERIRSRGKVHRHLRSLELEGPVPASGTELMVEQVPAGTITSAAELPLKGRRRIFALGMVREEAELKTETLTYRAGLGTGTARVLAAPPTF
jgi:folate-binding protein YgfZ